jgi:hypothetical protein
MGAPTSASTAEELADAEFGSMRQGRQHCDAPGHGEDGKKVTNVHGLASIQDRSLKRNQTASAKRNHLPSNGGGNTRLCHTANACGKSIGQFNSPIRTGHAAHNGLMRRVRRG